jgi:serine/threonine protein kinase
MADRVGQHIDDYRFIRLLGTGSFGEVYLGEHLKSQNLAAVKMLNLSQENLREFVKEASTTFRLKHPHIIPLLAFGMSADDTPYLVMDYASNGTLRQRHPKGTRLSLDTIVSYLLPLAEALQYAHGERVVHCDVKPDNVLIGQDGRLLLSDFGIAVIAPIEQSLNTQNLGGTAPYMAPEQIRGKPQPASDQYALGIMAYEWLCGVRPFQGTVWELLDQHRFQSPPLLRKKLPELPPMVEEIIFKALAKDPHDRFATIQEFAIALGQAYQGKTILRTSVDNAISLSSSVGQEVLPMSTVSVVTLPDASLPVAVPSGPSQGRTSDGLPNEEATSLSAHTTSVASQIPLELQSSRKRSWKGVAIVVSLLLMLISSGTLYALLGFPPSAHPKDSKVSLGGGGNRRGKVEQPSPMARETITPTVVPLTPTVDSQATAVAQEAVIATQTAVVGEAADTATAVAQITATAQVSTPEGLYRTVTSQSPSFSDSLAAQSARNWSSTSACTFSGGKYIISSSAGYFQPCYAVGTNLCNLGYQVQMTALGGDGGGLIFRYASNEYRLRVSPDGSYDLVNNSYTITSGSSGAIYKGINVTNQLTIIAQGSKIYVYINSQYITSVTDQASSCGAIGLMAVGFKNPGKAAFSSAKVWLL